MESEDDSINVSTKSTLEKTEKTEKTYLESDLGLSRLALASDSVTFTRRKAHYVPAKQSKLKNSLLVGVAFLELGNAGDFAANVWNDIPVPHFVVALMAVGGTLALFLSYFAFKDAKLGWCNLVHLREERRDLQRQKTHDLEDGQIIQGLDARLNVSFREIGTESISRVGLDVCMGVGGIIIGIGTFLAIGGANRRVWHASNLMSGYIGNVPLALYALFNGSWSCYVWMKARQHGIAGATALDMDMAAALLKRRIFTVQMYTAMVGVTGIAAGAASLISATMWWGYVILIPVIISSISCNYIWRKKIAYERPLVQQRTLGLSKISLLRELESIIAVQRILKETPSEPLHKLVSDSQSITSVIEFIIMNDLFEDFCVRLLDDTHLSELFGIPNEEITINSELLLTADNSYIPHILKIAQTCVSEVGPIHFQYRQRYLLEILGSYLCVSQAGTSETTTLEKC
ncbi:hypothetical protein V499_02728 [Pseudogymnoascus sp. VKM F-103]|nr:hypothetical protein V499_02728 [Pseudogymnoascus sp. VKM F-103]